MKILFDGDTYIQGPREIPKVWQGKYSNFHNAGDAIHIQEGWLEYAHADPDPDLAVDSKTYVRTGDTCTVQYVQRPYTKEELKQEAYDIVTNIQTAVSTPLDLVTTMVTNGLQGDLRRGRALSPQQQAILDNSDNDSRRSFATALLISASAIMNDIEAGTITTKEQIISDVRWPVYNV